MALATLENVVATVGSGSHNVWLTIDEDGLTVGTFGKLPWADSELEVAISDDGMTMTMTTGPSVTHYFVPKASFNGFGGNRSMKTFANFLIRAAVSAGARSPVAA